MDGLLTSGSGYYDGRLPNRTKIFASEAFYQQGCSEQYTYLGGGHNCGVRVYASCGNVNGNFELD
jgi:hypothetical protein